MRMWKIRVGMRGIMVGMWAMRVGMQGIRVGMQGIGVGKTKARVRKYFCKGLLTKTDL